MTSRRIHGDTPSALLLCGSPKVSFRAPLREPGAVTYLKGILEGLSDNGYRVQTFLFGDHLPLKNRRIDVGKGAPPWWWGGVDLARLALRPALRRWVHHRFSGSLPELVYEQYAPFQALGEVFRRQGIPWILATHSLMFEEAREMGTLKLWKLERRYELAAYHACDWLVVISEHLKQQLVEVGIPEEKILVMPNAISRTWVRTPDRVHRPFAEGFVVGFVGSLYPWQGLDLLLEAVHELRLAGHDLRVVVVGSGPVESSLKALAKRLGLQTAVHFHPPVPREELAAWIAGFDVGFSGHRDPFRSPLKIYEYLALGKPVVVTPTEDVERFFSRLPWVRTFMPGDREGLKEALYRFFQVRDHLSRQAETIRQHMRTHHVWGVRLRGLLDRIQRSGMSSQ